MTTAINDDGRILEDSEAFDWESHTPSYPLLPSIGEFDFDGFKNRWGAEISHHIIEVFMASDKSMIEEEREKSFRLSFENHTKARRRPNVKRPPQVDTWVQRARIHSPMILYFLQKVNDLRDWDITQPRVFFRPFGCLIDSYPHMKRLLIELEGSRADSRTEHSRNSTSEPTEVQTQHTAKADGIVESGSESSKSGAPDVMNLSMAREHLRCYIDFMDHYIMPLSKMFDGATSGMIRFNDLWYLFKLGEIVYVPNRRGDLARSQKTFMVHHRQVPTVNDEEPDDLRIEDPHSSEDRHMVLWTYYIDHDEDSYGPVKFYINICPWSGLRDIRKLPVYPLRFHERAAQIAEEIENQGKRFREFFQERYMSHEGWTVPSSPTSQNRSPSHFIESDVIIDFSEALKRDGELGPEFDLPGSREVTWDYGADATKIWHWPNPDQEGKRMEPCFTIEECTVVFEGTEMALERALVKNDPFLRAYKRDGFVKTLDGLDKVYNFLLPRRIFVYVLRQRRFVAVDTSSLKYIEQRPAIFDELRIESGHKSIIQSLVAEHFEKRERNRQQPILGSKYYHQDIIRGKGSGLSILLHGAPGVGKTATAEAVAQDYNKPLFAITCGDLGFMPDVVEEKLNDIFQLAHLWDCVLLLDEADVFLAQRDTQSLQRNALVSVFLRIMEYYKGIMFLTTNRVGALDEAFKSRIHISLYYAHLSRNQTIEIFRANFNRLKKNEEEKQKYLLEIGSKAPALLIKRSKIMEYVKWYYDEQSATPHRRWNGRQIRNAVHVAFSLASREMREKSRLASVTDDKIPIILDETHFDRVAEATERFGNYMDYARAMTDADRARLESTRADHLSNKDLTPSWKRDPYRTSGSSAATASKHEPRAFPNSYQQPGGLFERSSIPIGDIARGQGSWGQNEGYIQSHSSASVAHSHESIRGTAGLHGQTHYGFQPGSSSMGFMGQHTALHGTQTGLDDDRIKVDLTENVMVAETTSHITRFRPGYGRAEHMEEGVDVDDV